MISGSPWSAPAGFARCEHAAGGGAGDGGHEVAAVEAPLGLRRLLERHVLGFELGDTGLEAGEAV